MPTFARAVALHGHGAQTGAAIGHWRGVALPGHGALTATAICNRAAGNLPGQGVPSATATLYKVAAINQNFPYDFPFVFGPRVGVAGVGGFTATTSQLCNSPGPIIGHGQLTAQVNTLLVFFPVTGYYFAVANPEISGVLNKPIVQPINGLVTFTPRLAKGQLLYMDSFLITPAYNALQQVFLIGNPNGGTWTLSFGSKTTDALPFDATPDAIQTALENLETVGPENVVVVQGAPPLSYNVEFINALGNQFMPPLVGNGDDLLNPVGPGHCEVTTTVTLLGSEQIIGDSGIAISQLTARIWNGVLSTIDFVDTPGFQLPANIEALNIEGALIYDVAFSKVTYNGADQLIAPFAFVAPTDDTPICLTNPELDRLPYNAPSTTTFVPSPPPLMLVEGGRMGWRERAAVQQARRRTG